MKTLQSTSTAALGLLIVMTANPCAAQICPGLAQESWDAGSTSGWIGGAGTVVTLIPTGGNPNGYLLLDDLGQAQIQTELPPWIGDWGAGGIRELALHMQLFGSGDGIYVPRLRIRRDASSNGWMYWGNTILTVDGTWHSFAAPIDPNWSDVEAEAHGWLEIASTVEWTWAETVSSVAYLIVGSDGVDSGELLGVDNVEIACWAFADGFESGTTSAWDEVVP